MSCIAGLLIEWTGLKVFNWSIFNWVSGGTWERSGEKVEKTQWKTGASNAANPD